MSDVGFSQLDHRSPVALPTGTRSEAMPPAAAASANGAISEPTADSVSIARTSASPELPERSA